MLQADISEYTMVYISEYILLRDKLSAMEIEPGTSGAERHKLLLEALSSETLFGLASAFTTRGKK